MPQIGDVRCLPVTPRERTYPTRYGSATPPPRMAGHCPKIALRRPAPALPRGGLRADRGRNRGRGSGHRPRRSRGSRLLRDPARNPGLVGRWRDHPASPQRDSHTTRSRRASSAALRRAPGSGPSSRSTVGASWAASRRQYVGPTRNARARSQSGSCRPVPKASRSWLPISTCTRATRGFGLALQANQQVEGLPRIRAPVDQVADAQQVPGPCDRHRQRGEARFLFGGRPGDAGVGSRVVAGDARRGEPGEDGWQAAPARRVL